MSCRFDATNLIKGLGEFETKVNMANKMFAETVSKDFESYAKKNRPWTDRTSRARQGLTGYVKPHGVGWRVYLAHTVDYGIWLEYAHDKNYAILEPTIRAKSPEVLEAWNKHLSKW